MITQILRDPWRAMWRVATMDGTLAISLLALAAGVVFATLLPQRPLGDAAAYARWLSETQAQLGRAAPTLQTLGLFTVTRSFGFRTLLALTAACLALRLIEIGGRLQRKWAWADLFTALSHAGALMLLAGLLVTHLGGWQIAGVIVQSGERVTLPGDRGWVALAEGGLQVTHNPGFVTFVETRGPGLRVSATDNSGQTLLLYQAAELDPVTELSMPLTEDRYFAIPDAELVVRLVPQPNQSAGARSPVLVQVYHSPPGELAVEAVTEGDAEVTVGGVALHLVSEPYAKVTATFNPGLWPSSAGIVLLVAGLLGGVALYTGRSWTGKITSAGNAPASGEEA